jgi:sugar-specific transcriptional regulator TrmB
MNKLDEYFKQLGLSEPETKFYLTLLKIGSTTVGNLAQVTGNNRTSAYDYIDSLIEKGLVTKLVKGSKSLVTATNPEESLGYLIEEKTQETKALQEDFSKVLPLLPQFQDPGEAEVRHYKGKNGVRKIYEEALKAKEVRSYVNLSEMGGVFPENSDIFTNAFKHNRELKMFEIFEDSPQSKIAIQNQANNKSFFYKFFPANITLHSVDTLIYDNNVAIINVRNQITGVIFQNTDYYNSSKELFDLIWNVLPNEKS